MRTGGTLFNSSPVARFTTTATPGETFSPPDTIQPSPWHSPTPYILGGLAAMLGLLACALLVLACSYRKLSGQVNDGVSAGSGNKSSPVFEEKLLVIMAGEVNPTFLATPTSTTNSSFIDEKIIINSKDNMEKETNEEEQTHYQNYSNPE